MRAETPQQWFEMWAAAFHQRDEEGMAALFEDDAVLLVPPGERLVHGREKIAKEAMQFASISELTVHKVDVIQKGDVAIGYVNRTHRLSPPGREPFEVSGISTDVVRRQPDGGWLVAIDNPNGTDVTAPSQPGETGTVA